MCVTHSATAESTFKYLEYQWFENQEQQVERLEKKNLCRPARLTQSSRVWIKFHLSAFWATCFLANDPSPRCIILRQWCRDLALPQSHNPMMTSSCMGLCYVERKIKKETEELRILSKFIIYELPVFWFCQVCTHMTRGSSYFNQLSINFMNLSVRLLYHCTLLNYLNC